jgi:hypothetical protein
MILMQFITLMEINLTICMNSSPYNQRIFWTLYFLTIMWKMIAIFINKKV